MYIRFVENSTLPNSFYSSDFLENRSIAEAVISVSLEVYYFGMLCTVSMQDECCEIKTFHVQTRYLYSNFYNVLVAVLQSLTVTLYEFHSSLAKLQSAKKTAAAKVGTTY